METREQYFTRINRFGRISFAIFFVLMFAIPTVVCAVYDIFPSLATALKATMGLFLILTPIALSEIVSFVPLLGSGASYLTFETGNVSNIKLPCAMNALKLAGVQPASEEGEVLSTISVAISSIVTTAVIMAAALLLAPLAPVFANPSVRIATANVLPALFGALVVAFLTGGDSGPVVIRGQWKAFILPLLVVAVIHYLVFPIKGWEGVTILVLLPITILGARFLFKRGQITVVSKEAKP
ncbi:MAG TPA: hypothetical protein P5313_08885 [Spirochaetia bacterium]|nr:hypothetical protein [Spirochaetales bacterium]HRY80518.1 hypothetical protein [Spirochaetia bacterium]